MGPMPKKPAYEQIKFVAPTGTRALYRSAAALADKDWKMWVRETLHARALQEHAERGVEYEDPPPAQPMLPPPLQDRKR